MEGNLKAPLVVKGYQDPDLRKCGRLRMRESPFLTFSGLDASECNVDASGCASPSVGALKCLFASGSASLSVGDLELG